MHQGYISIPKYKCYPIIDQAHKFNNHNQAKKAQNHNQAKRAKK